MSDRERCDGDLCSLIRLTPLSTVHGLVREFPLSCLGSRLGKFATPRSLTQLFFPFSLKECRASQSVTSAHKFGPFLFVSLHRPQSLPPFLASILSCLLRASSLSSPPRPKIHTANTPDTMSELKPEEVERHFVQLAELEKEFDRVDVEIRKLPVALSLLHRSLAGFSWGGSCASLGGHIVCTRPFRGE